MAAEEHDHQMRSSGLPRCAYPAREILREAKLDLRPEDDSANMANTDRPLRAWPPASSVPPYSYRSKPSEIQRGHVCTAIHVPTPKNVPEVYLYCSTLEQEQSMQKCIYQLGAISTAICRRHSRHWTSAE